MASAKKKSRKSVTPRKESIGEESVASAGSRTTRQDRKRRNSDATTDASNPTKTPTRASKKLESSNSCKNSKRKSPQVNVEQHKTQKMQTPETLAIATPSKSSATKSKSSTSRRKKTSPPTNTVIGVKAPPTLDVQVHRLRHLGYHPKPIVAMAATPPSVSESYLAIARDNGSVELKSVQQKFRTIATIAGFPSRIVTVMTWVHDCGEESSPNPASLPKLVGASRDGSLFFIDFTTGQLSNTISSGGGGIFCLATLGPYSSFVAAGCEDGSIRIYDVSDKPVLLSTMPSTGAAVLALAWHRGINAARNNSMAGTTIFAGVADGTIRRYDCVSTEGTNKNNSSRISWKSTLRMTVENFGRNIPTRVWSISILKDGTVVSGDSLGHVQFWDGDSGSLQQTFIQNDEKADVLCMAVSQDEDKVFASGIDSRVVCIERPPMTPGGDGLAGRKWTLTHAHRPHTHDVKCMTVCQQHKAIEREGKLKTITVDLLCSGGMDTKVCLYQVREFPTRRPLTLYPWPSSSPIMLAKQARLLLMRREDRVDLYRLGPQQTGDLNTPVLVPEEETLVGSVQVKTPSNLACTAISNDGSLLAICNAVSLLVFRIAFSEQGTMTPTRIPQDFSFLGPCNAVRFTPTNDLVVATADGKIQNLPFTPNMAASATESMYETRDAVKQTIITQASQNSLSVESLEISVDGRWMATMQSGLCGEDRISLYHSSSPRESFSHWWTIPPLDTAVSAIAFLSIDSPVLVVACCNYATPWSEEAGYPLDKAMPLELSNRNDFPVRLAVNPTSASQFLVGSFGAFVTMSMDKSYPKFCRNVPEIHVRGRKRKRSLSVTSSDEVDQSAAACTCCLRYNSMLFVDFVDENEMVVVEQPWMSVVATFPQGLQRKVYGA
ncbi:predicted protein [Phaeodactylum tricornutum CCAP 1055/1]|uniref:Uncharacterized protein n=2 Tax=Phaeodactylum tricornutum TaxID=2850 RepID=B5Y5U4_PHATC|nr:predicted protein [Phaeodactylum tricornutum CCAP 1055/1]ACI65996.1 predicted protein [Phaeodactylum tricornutum CCAP 1055/1]|eukprot:XP_002186526.1 predicted protein [Phaeodactylum tricornutum CCAP 1055/1]